MTPKPLGFGFIAILLYTLLSLLYISQGGQALRATHLSSHSARFLSQNVTLAPGEDTGKASHLLSKRAPPVDVNDSDQKGQGLMCKLRDADPDEKLQSDFTTDDLNHWYSNHSYGMDSGQVSTTGQKISEAIERLGLPTKIGEQGLRGFNYVQDREYEKNGDLEGPGWGHFIGVMSPKASYISTEDNHSSRDEEGISGPSLNRISDIYFLIWKEMATGKALTNIKYFARYHMVNSHSKKIAFEAAGNKIPVWPGKSFDMSTPQGRAILATPNGVAVAWFLINHKEALGVKVPTKVTVFKTLGADLQGNPEDWIHFMFFIAPYSGKKGGK